MHEGEQALFCRLAVFAGGWTLKAAEQVCSDESVDKEAVLDLLTSLIDKSLMVAEERNGATRHRLLETVRQYARERLRESGEEAYWRGRHLAYFLAVAEEGEPHLMGADQQAWLDRLETEHDNMRSALAWSSTTGGNVAGGLRLAGALWRFWSVHGYLGEGRGWLSELLTAVPGKQVAASRAKALHGAGGLALQQGDYPSARALYEESLAIRRELGDRRAIAGSLNNLGNLAYGQGDYPSARALHEESLAIYRELGDRGGVANSLNNLGTVSCDEGDYPSARALHEESLAIQRELGDRGGIAASLNNLGIVASEQGDYPSARELYEDSLALMRELGDRWGIAWSLEGLANVAFSLARPGRAARIWGGAERLREEIGAPLPPNERPRYEGQVAASRAAMVDDAAFDRAWQEGRAMTLEQAVEYALKGQDE